MCVSLALSLTLLCPAALRAQPQKSDGSEDRRTRTVRHAVLVGNDNGVPPHSPLRFAEDDARRMKKVLVEVGGFEEDNVLVLLGKGEAELKATLDRLRQDLSGREKGTGALLLFYFSGHSDGSALEMGHQAVDFVKVKKWMEDSGAEVRLAIVDTCMSGRLIGLKGMSRVPAFDVKVHGDLQTQGTVILTSSTAGEMAQESGEIGGAFYTHHLVSGLYGAADEDGDLRVSLREAYRYAYRTTVGDTVQSIAGTQHPAYSIKLEGWGDLILSTVTDEAAFLAFPAGSAGDYFILTQPSGEMIAELPHEGDREARLFIAPGSYLVARKTARGLEGVEVTLSRGETRKIDPAEFNAIRRKLADVRGGRDRSTLGLYGYYALSGWLMPNMGAVHAGGLLCRLKFDVFELQGRLSFGATSVNDHGFAYDMNILQGAFIPALRFAFHKVDVLAGLLVGTSRLGQDSETFGKEVAWSFDAGVLLGVSVELLSSIVLLLSWEFDVHVFSMDGDYRVQYAPKGALGLGYEF